MVSFIRNPVNQFGLCFETPLRLILRSRVPDLGFTRDRVAASRRRGAGAPQQEAELINRIPFHCALMPASRMTFAQRAASALI